MRRPPDPIAKKYYDTGGAFFEQNKHDEAIACYTRAIEEDREYGSAYFNRALSYAILSRYREATEDAKMVLLLEPESHDGLYVLGVIHEYQHDYENAAGFYRASLSKKPDYLQAKERLKNLEIKMQSDRATPAEDINVELDEESDVSLSCKALLAEAEPHQPQLRTGRTLIVEGQIKGLALNRPRKRMEDVIGLEEVKRELELSVIGPAKRPEALKRWGIDDGLSILLYGPSGCGKTHLVEALAGEIGA